MNLSSHQDHSSRWIRSQHRRRLLFISVVGKFRWRSTSSIGDLQVPPVKVSRGPCWAHRKSTFAIGFHGDRRKENINSIRRLIRNSARMYKAILFASPRAVFWSRFRNGSNRQQKPGRTDGSQKDQRRRREMRAGKSESPTHASGSLAIFIIIRTAPTEHTKYVQPLIARFLCCNLSLTWWNVRLLIMTLVFFCFRSTRDRADIYCLDDETREEPSHQLSGEFNLFSSCVRIFYWRILTPERCPRLSSLSLGRRPTKVRRMFGVAFVHKINRRRGIAANRDEENMPIEKTSLRSRVLDVVQSRLVTVSSDANKPSSSENWEKSGNFTNVERRRLRTWHNQNSERCSGTSGMLAQLILISSGNHFHVQSADNREIAIVKAPVKPSAALLGADLWSVFTLRRSRKPKHSLKSFDRCCRSVNRAGEWLDRWIQSKRQ